MLAKVSFKRYVITYHFQGKITARLDYPACRFFGQLHAKLHISPRYAVRKDFTDSERVAIGRAIEESLGNRQGQRTDLQPRQNFGEVNAKRTDEIAAQKAGFNNKETYIL